MKAKHPTANPALPTAEPAISHSSVKPKRNTRKAEDLVKETTPLDELRLLRQVIEEAKKFCKTGPARTPGR
jgi:hypothetical protein